MDASMEGEDPMPNGEAHDDQPKSKASRSLKTPLQKEALEAAYSINPLPSEEVRKALGDRIELTAHQVQVWFSGRRRKDKLAIEKLQARAASAAPAGGTPGSSPAPPSPLSQKPAQKLPGGPGTSPASQSKAARLTPQEGSPAPGDQGFREASEAAPVQHAAGALDTAASASELPEEPPSPEEIDVANETELYELIAIARSQLPAELTQGGAPPLGFVFDSVPLEETEARGEKRKRIMIDDLEMEGGIGGHVNVMRNEFGGAKRFMSREERETRRWEDAAVKENAKLRVAQEREAKRMAEQADKEHRAAVRKQDVERRRQEKEMLKALAQQERQATRSRHRDAHAGPRDDLDIEMEGLLAKQQRSHPEMLTEGAVRPAAPQPPPFPPPGVRLEAAFPVELGAELGPEVLMLWGFLHSFSDILGLSPASVDAVLAAVALGERSRLLCEMHMALLRLLQADMEEAHAVAGQGLGAASIADKAISQSAACLEEAWAWGFDVDVWRAHLNALTWPEVLREFAIAAGLGRKRPRPRKEARPKMGSEGEDVVADEGGGLKLHCPARFQPGTMKAAAWQVLSEAGPAGLNVVEIAKRIQKQGLRDLRTAKSPEASVAAALSRDVVFGRPAPATYCLASFLTAAALPNGAGEMGTSAVADESKQPAVIAANGQGSVGGVKPEPATDASPSEEAAPAQAAPEQALAAGAPVKAESESGVKQEAPIPAVNGDPAVKAEPLNGASGSAGLVAPAAAAAVLLAHQQNHKSPEETAQNIGVKAEPDAKGEASMQNGAPAAKPAEDIREEGTAHTGHESEEESDLEDEEDEHENQAAGEPWVRELATSEYGALPLPTRLGILGALVQLALDGPSVRAALEAKLEEAARVRKAMAEDAKAEKKKYQAEAAERARRKAEQAKQALEAFQRMNNVQADPNAQSQPPLLPANPETENMEIEMDESVANAAAKQRQQERAEKIRQAEEDNAVRFEELGLDRRHNRYWHFAAGTQPGAGLIYVELQGGFRVIRDAQSVAALRDALERRGAREGHLAAILDRRTDAILRSMPGTALRMPQLGEADSAALDSEHNDWVCSIPTQAHVKAVRPGEAPSLALSDANVMAGAPPAKLAKLRGDLTRVQGSLPRSALQEDWDADRWGKAVAGAGSMEELRTLLAELELSVHAEYVSPHFRHTPPAVPGAWLPPAAPPQPEAAPEGSAAAAKAEASEAAQRLAWLPATAAAVSLRLAAFDAAVVYEPGMPPARDTLQAYRYIQRPAAPTQVAGYGPNTPGTRVISGQPIGMGGRSRPSTFPPFPQALLQGPPKEFTLPIEELRAAVARAAEHGEPALEPSEAPVSSDPGSGTPSLPKASRGTTPVSRLGIKSQAAKKKSVKSNLRKEFDRMATSGGWDNDEDDDEQGYSAEEMDIDQAAGGSAAASGAEGGDSEDDAESNGPEDEEDLEISD